MRRQKRRRLEAAQELTITSMVDMFTLLLTFLLNFVSPSDPSAHGLLLPESTSTAEVGAGVVLLVTPTDVRVGEQRVAALDGSGASLRLPADAAGTLAGIADALRAAREARPTSAPSPSDSGTDGPTLLVQCDRSVPYALVSQLLGAAHDAGFERFRLIVDGRAG